MRPPPPALLDEEFVGPFPSWKSVKDFGAKGDGITDDSNAIQAALTALKTIQTNAYSVLYFPAGTLPSRRPWSPRGRRTTSIWAPRSSEKIQRAPRSLGWTTRPEDAEPRPLVREGESLYVRR